MALTLAAIQGATQYFLGQNQLSIDNWTFKLFYQGSVSILVASSVLVTCNQLFGSPIECDLPRGGVSDDVLKSYCWMYSTFNIPTGFEGNCARTTYEDRPIYNSYYQWVPIFLIFQAFLFYVPRVLWLMMEGGLMKFLAKGRTDRIIEDPEDKLQTLLRTFRHNLQNKYNRYAYIFFSCEVLNFLVVVSQIFITNTFLQDQFLLYGFNVVQFYRLPAEEVKIRGIVNPMCEVFPRVTSCTYWKYGSGGRQTGLSALCILSLNIIIDKIYLVLWFWFIIISILGGIRIVCRIFQLSFPCVRYYLIKSKMHRYFRNNPHKHEMKCYIKSCTIGDWFVLHQMSKNLNRRFFNDFLIQLSKDSTKEN